MAVQDPREISRQKGLGENYASNKTSSGEKKTSIKDEKTKDDKTNKSLRYPYAMLKDNTDYLKIEIAEYQPPGLNFGDLQNDKKDADGKVVLDDKGKVVKEGFNLDFSLESGSNKNRSIKNVRNTIYLPIPQQLTDSTSVSWDSGGLNPAEAFGVAAISGVINVIRSGKPIESSVEIANALLAAAPNLLGDPNLSKAAISALAGKAVGNLGGNVSATQLISRATGQVFNPNLELLFEGANIRQFPFTFEFFPRNAKEADQVKRIIRVLKQSMSAKKNGKTGNTGKIFISAPDIFHLTYMKGKNKHPFLNTFLPMALVSLNVSYTGSNTYSTFYDGTPTHMRMELIFKELNPIYNEDYDTDEAKGGVGY